MSATTWRSMLTMPVSPARECWWPGAKAPRSTRPRRRESPRPWAPRRDGHRQASGLSRLAR